MFEGMWGEKIKVENPELPESWEGVFSPGELLLIVDPVDEDFVVSEVLSFEEGSIRLWGLVGNSIYDYFDLAYIHVGNDNVFDIYRCSNKLYSFILLSSMNDNNDIVIFS